MKTHTAAFVDATLGLSLSAMLDKKGKNVKKKIIKQ